MKRIQPAALAAAAICIATLFAPSAAGAANVMEMEADQLIRAAAHARDTLALTPNQQTLWQQVESKSAAILRERKQRRERLQSTLKEKLADPRQELRALAAAVEQEAATGAAEQRALRALWLGLCDALNDQQREQASRFLVSQLERVDQPPPQGERGAPPGERGQMPGGGRGRARGNGAGAGF